MRLAITVDPLGEQMGGIGRYTLELCKGLGRRSDVGALQYYRNGRWIADPYALLRNEEILCAPPRFLPKRYQAWREQRMFRTHLFHGTNFFLPAQAEMGVVTVHDLSVIRFPELHPEARIRAFEREFAGSVARAAHIITPSEVIRREVIDYLGCASDHVTAIALAAGPDYRPRLPEEIAHVLGRWGLAPNGYGLSVATIEPRKKLEQSLAAWEALPAAMRRRWPLVIVGGEGWENDQIRARIDRGERDGWVRNLGYLPEEELPLLYAGARLLLYPSTYEGFGLPAVEALASGIPCLISDRSCLVEVTQGAAMAVDPDDIDAFSRAIERALMDDSWRRDVTEAGLRVASGYSWDRCVARTVDVYRKVLGARVHAPAVAVSTAARQIEEV